MTVSNKNLFPARYMGDLCYFALDDNWAKLAPVGYPIYTLAEAKMLAGFDEQTKRFVHEAKKLAGAKVAGMLVRDANTLVAYRCKEVVSKDGDC